MSGIASDSAFDIFVYQGSLTQNNNYVVAPHTGYVSYFTYAANDTTLKNLTQQNTNWTNAGCWDWSGSYVKLKKWSDVYGSATVNFVSNLAGVANPAPQTSTGGSPITMPNLTDPTGNKLLAGWATSPSATSATYMPNRTILSQAK